MPVTTGVRTKTSKCGERYSLPKTPLQRATSRKQSQEPGASPPAPEFRPRNTAPSPCVPTVAELCTPRVSGDVASPHAPSSCVAAGLAAFGGCIILGLWVYSERGLVLRCKGTWRIGAWMLRSHNACVVDHAGGADLRSTWGFWEGIGGMEFGS